MSNKPRKKDLKLIEASAAIMGAAPEGDDIAFLHSDLMTGSPASPGPMWPTGSEATI